MLFDYIQPQYCNMLDWSRQNILIFVTRTNFKSLMHQHCAIKLIQLNIVLHSHVFFQIQSSSTPQIFSIYIIFSSQYVPKCVCISFVKVYHQNSFSKNHSINYFPIPAITVCSMHFIAIDKVANSLWPFCQKEMRRYG